MDNNKVLVRLIVPEIDKTYDVLLPISRKIGNILYLLNKGLEEQNGNSFKANNHGSLYNRYTGTRYSVNSIIYDTDIRNDTILVMM